jgi:hypothetical protein
MRAYVVGAVLAPASVTMTVATTASVPIAPIARLCLTSGRRPSCFLTSALSFRRGTPVAQWQMPDLRPERLSWRTLVIVECSAEGEHQSND